MKKTAAARLAAIDGSAHDSGKRAVNGVAVAPPRPPAVAPGVAPGATPAVTRPAPPEQPPPEAAAPPAPRPPPRTAPQSSISDLASSSNPADWQRARDMLEPKVFSHRGSTSDIRTLKAICKQQHDQQCVDQCVQELK